MIERLGKYQIEAQIGRGGMGAVYRAHDPLLKRQVALKVISENVDVNDELRARFFREAQACAQLSHPNIITIHDLGEDEGRLFIVMEYLEGEELKQIITQRRDLPLESKLALMVQICDGLAYAHQKGIVHRDIKPGNVFVLRNGTAKVLDFGVARLASANDDLTHTGLIMGTLRYMPPEQVRGRVDQRSDMFSAGAVFYELIAYHAPLTADDPMAILEELHSTAAPSLFRPDPAIPADLGAVIERALRKNPDERFRDMTEMREALEAVRARLAEEAAGLRRRLEARAAEMRELHAQLVEQVGGEVAQEVLPVPGERAPVSVLEAAWRDSEEKLARLQERVLQARALRPEYERAMDRMRLGQWDAAAEALGAHRGRDAGARRRPGGTGAGARRDSPGRRGVAARTGGRRARSAAHGGAETRAAPAAAVEDQEGPWSSAEATRAAGLSALDDQGYGTARELFEAAAEQYRTAAEALDRRVQQLLGDARRRLEQRQFEECLPLVNEVLTLIPDQPEAAALHLEAQRGAREEADRRAALEQRYDAARTELAAGDLQGAIGALTDLLEEDPDHTRARRLLADARAQVAEEEARVQRLLAEAQARLAEEEARVRLAEEERARLAEEEARARQLLADAQAQLAEVEARARLAAEEARARQLLDAAHELSGAASLDQTVLKLPGDATVIERSERADPGAPHPTPVAVEPPVSAKAVEPPEAQVGLPPAESAATWQDAGRAQPGRLRRMRERPLVLAVGVLLVIASAILVWVTTSLLPRLRLQGEIAQARVHLVAAREMALKVEADRLAAKLFTGAAAKESDGEKLVSAGRLEAALAALREATQGYEEAGPTAKAVAEERAKADQAREDMLAAKAGAAQETPQFKEGLARETEGSSLYVRLAFQDAAESFRAAARLFALPLPSPQKPAPAPLVAPVSPSTTGEIVAAEIHKILRLYRTGLRNERPHTAPAAAAGPPRGGRRSLSRHLRPDAELPAESEGRENHGEWRRGRGEGAARGCHSDA